MSKIKMSGTSSESTSAAEKDFQLVRQQAEMKAGEALIREASKKIEEQREDTLTDDTETEERQPRDTAQLSDVRLHSHDDKAGTMDEIFKWVLEMSGKNWEVFLEWWPEPDIPLANQLQELSKLYLNLLESAFKHAEGENLTKQMERLDSLLARKLNVIMEQNLKELTIFLEKAGQTAVIDSIRSSLYRQTAGRTLSPQATHRLFLQEPPSLPRSSCQEGDGSFPSAFSSAPHAARSASALSSLPFSEEGMIYQSSRKQNTRFQQVYHKAQGSWKEQIKQRNEIISNARKGIVENTFRQTGSIVCSVKELEAANRFAAHVNGRGNLLQNPDISAGNDEITGLLAAVMSMKGQVYAIEAGESNSLVLSLQKAIGKMIEHYLNQKGAAKIYYHTLDIYRRLRNPLKAVQAGQDYAYQRFCEKQRDPVYQKSAPYSREAGFFRALLKNLSPEKELALGTNILQKDWENFLRSIGKIKKSSYSSKAEHYSPWGMLLDPGIHHTENSGNSVKIFISIAVILLIGSLVIIWLK